MTEVPLSALELPDEDAAAIDDERDAQPEPEEETDDEDS